MKRTIMVCVGMLCALSGLRGQAAEEAERLLNQAWRQFSVHGETNAVALFEQVLASNPKPQIKDKAKGAPISAKIKPLPVEEKPEEKKPEKQ